MEIVTNDYGNTRIVKECAVMMCCRHCQSGDIWLREKQYIKMPKKLSEADTYVQKKYKFL